MRDAKDRPHQALLEGRIHHNCGAPVTGGSVTIGAGIRKVYQHRVEKVQWGAGFHYDGYGVESGSGVQVNYIVDTELLKWHDATMTRDA